MIIDHELAMSYKQAITVSTVSTNVIDLGPAMWAGNAGDDRGIPLVIAVDQVFAAAGAATLMCELQSSPVENFGSGVITHQTDTFPKAELIQNGKVSHSFHIPPDVQQFVRMNYTVGTGPFTAGKLTVAGTASRQTNR